MSRTFIKRQNISYEVHMRCVTWSKESHGLFDFESRHVTKRNIKSTRGGRLFRFNNDVELVHFDKPV